jgi:SAM-dependent methyltransferase
LDEPLLSETFVLPDIHDAAFEDRVRAALERDYLPLVARKAEFVDAPCPACLSARREPAFDCKGFQYSRCLGCKTLYMYPCPSEPLILWFLSYSEALRMWREEMPPATLTSRQRMYRERVQYVWQSLERLDVKAESLVEIGAGGGQFARLLIDEGRLRRVILVEPQPLELRLPGVEVIGGGFSSVKLDEPVDVLVAFEVLEHLVDPGLFLGMVRRCVVPGGVVILTTPNAKGYEVEVLRERSSSVPFDHVRLYNPESLELLLRRYGLEAVEITTPGRLDVQMVRREYQKGGLDLSARPALEVLMRPEAEGLRAELQRLLVARRQSSHMRCIARRPA